VRTGNNLVTASNPLSIEYKKICITSSHFDLFGSSQLLVTNSIKTSHTKDKIMDNVVYYDKSVKPVRNGNWFGPATLTIDNFDPSEYGSPICYYNPSYNASTINLVTKFFETDNASYIKNIINCIRSTMSAASVLPTFVTPYLSIANKVLSSSTDFITSFVCNKELCKEHVIEFRTDDFTKPFVIGYYICFPNVSNANELRYVIDNYRWEDNAVVTTVANEIVEYNDSYFVLEIADGGKEGLMDFDFAAATNKMMSSTSSASSTSMDEFIGVCKRADDLERIKLICDAGDSIEDKLAQKINYYHLSTDSRHWFDKVFYQTSHLIKNL
jgi:hypothetical protein